MITPDYDPNSINAVLSRIETKVNTIDSRLEKGDKRMDNQDERIQKLERWRYWLLGLSAALVFLAQAAWEWFTGKKH